MEEKKQTFKEKLTFRNIIRIISAVLIILFFVPSFMVSCQGAKIPVSGVNTLVGLSVNIYGEKQKIADPYPAIIVLLLIPAGIFVIWFLKEKLSAKITAIITLAAAALDLVIWLVFRWLVATEALSEMCTFKVAGGFVFTMLFLILLMAISIGVMVGFLKTDISLFQAGAIGSMQGLQSATTATTGSGKWKCPKCGELIDNSFQFCGKCGTPKPPEAAPKFCQNCGTAVEKTMIFCVHCGAKIERMDELSSMVPDTNTPGIETTNPVASQASPPVPGAPMQSPGVSVPVQKTEKKKWIPPKWFLPTCIGAAAGIVLVVVLGINISRTINLNDYLVVQFEGYDGFGRATEDHNWDQFLIDLAKKSPGNLDPSSYEFQSKLDYVHIDGELSEKEGLSNGDVIKYIWDVDKNEFKKIFKVNLKYHDEEYTVNGLEEIGSFDPFADLEVSFSGINGRGTLDYADNNGKYEGLRFDPDKRDNLSNGDAVTFTVTSYGNDSEEYFAEQYGVIPSEMSKQYIVDGLSSYLTSLDEIPPETMKEIEEQAKDVFQSQWIRDADENDRLVSVDYIGSYLLTAKNPDDIYGYGYNILYPVFQISIQAAPDEGERPVPVVYYYAVEFRDLLMQPDGTCIVDLSNYNVPYHSFRKILNPEENNSWRRVGRYYDGYETVDDLTDDLVTTSLADYTYESSISGTPQVSVTDLGNTAEIEAGDPSEQIIPESSTREITEMDLEGLTAQELTYARNEIYARHGYVFDSEELNAYFGQKEWYEPNPSFDGTLSTIEQKNAELIRKYQESEHLEYKPQ